MSPVGFLQEGVDGARHRVLATRSQPPLHVVLHGVGALEVVQGEHLSLVATPL